MQGTDRSETDIAIFQNLANPKFVDFSQSPKEVVGNYSKHHTSQKSGGGGAFSQRVQTIIKSTNPVSNTKSKSQRKSKSKSSSSSSDSDDNHNNDKLRSHERSSSRNKHHRRKSSSNSSSSSTKSLKNVTIPIIPPPPLLSSKYTAQHHHSQQQQQQLPPQQQYVQEHMRNQEEFNMNNQFPLNAPFVHDKAPSIRASHKVFEQQEQQHHSERRHQQDHHHNSDRRHDEEKKRNSDRHSNRRHDKNRHSDRRSDKRSDRHSKRQDENEIRKMQADEFFRGNEYDPDDEEVKMEKNRVLMELDGLEKKYNLKLYRKFSLKDPLSEMKFALDQYNTDLDVKAGVGFLKFAIPLLLSGIEKGNQKFLKGWLKIDGFSQDIRKDMSDPLESTKWDYVLDRVYRKYFRKSTSKSPLRQLTEMLVWGLALKHIQQALPGGQVVAAIASGFLQESLHPKPPVTRFTSTSMPSNVPNVPNMSNNGTEQANSPQYPNQNQSHQNQNQQQQQQYTQTGYNPQNVPPASAQQPSSDIPLNQPMTMNPVTLPINRNLTVDNGGSRKTLKRPSAGIGLPMPSPNQQQQQQQQILQQPLHPVPVQSSILRAPSNEEYIQKGRLMEQQERIRLLEAQLQIQENQFKQHAASMQTQLHAHYMDELKKATEMTKQQQQLQVQSQQRQQNIPRQHPVLTPVLEDKKLEHDEDEENDENELQCKVDDDNDSCSISNSTNSENSNNNSDEEENDKKVLNRNDKVLHNTLLQAGIVLDSITEE